MPPMEAQRRGPAPPLFCYFWRTPVRNPKPGVKALFAAIEQAREADEQSREHLLKFPAEPPAERAITVDPVWLSMFSVKGRA